MELIFIAFIIWFACQFISPLEKRHVEKMAARALPPQVTVICADLPEHPQVQPDTPLVGEEMAFLYLHDQFVNDMQEGDLDGEAFGEI